MRPVHIPFSFVIPLFFLPYGFVQAEVSEKEVVEPVRIEAEELLRSTQFDGHEADPMHAA